MTDAHRTFSQALKRSRLASFAQELRKLWWIIASGILVLAGLIYWHASPRRVVGSVYGIATGAHQVQMENGQGPLQVSVALDDGRIVAVSLPRGAAFRQGARMKVDVRDREWPPRASIYRFVGYVEENEKR